MENLRDHVAGRLRELRKQQGITPEQASARVGCIPSSSYIRRVEKGLSLPSLEALAGMCTAYGTRLDRFFLDVYRGDPENGNGHGSKDKRSAKPRTSARLQQPKQI